MTEEGPNKLTLHFPVFYIYSHGYKVFDCEDFKK